MPTYETRVIYKGQRNYVNEGADAEEAEERALERYKNGDEGEATGSEWESVENVVTEELPPGTTPGALTIDAAIKLLVDLRERSKLGGQTCLAICLDGSEIPFVNVTRLTYEPDQDGALVLAHGDARTAS